MRESRYGFRHPRDVWNIIQGYGIGRMLFVMRTASQLSGLDASRATSYLLSFPKRRFTVSKLALKSDLIRIHLIDVGGQIHVRNLTDPTGDHGQIPTDVYDKRIGIVAKL